MAWWHQVCWCLLSWKSAGCCINVFLCGSTGWSAQMFLISTWPLFFKIFQNVANQVHTVRLPRYSLCLKCKKMPHGIIKITKTPKSHHLRDWSVLCLEAFINPSSVTLNFWACIVFSRTVPGFCYIFWQLGLTCHYQKRCPHSYTFLSRLTRRLFYTMPFISPNMCHIIILLIFSIWANLFVTSPEI